MKNKVMNRIALACLATGVLALTAGAQQTDRNKVYEIKNKPMVEFKMKTLEDKVITNKDLKGKVYVVDFWATWCGPCVAAAPKLQAMYEEYKDQDFLVIGANCGESGEARGKKDNAVAYQKEHGYSYMFTYGNEELFKKLACWGYPTFFVVDQEGVVKDVVVGFNEAQIRKTVTGLLAENK